MSELVATTFTDHSPPSVVIVDDEPAILAAFTSLLRRQHVRTHTFASSVEALEFLTHHAVDIIISDTVMPDLTGPELFEHVSRVHPDSVRILMTGHAEKEVIFNAIDRGIAQYYIFKPWDDATLRTTIADAIRTRQELQNLHLKEVLKSVAGLPSPPKFQAGLWEVLAKPDQAAHELAAQIEHSPALVAKLLRVANSVFFGARQRITTVLDAIQFVGMQSVASMAISIESFQAATAGMNGRTTAHVDAIWERSLHRAALARTIGSRWGGFQQLQILNIASLLQDIGLVVQLCSQTEKFERFLLKKAEPRISPYEAEREVFGVTHDRVGEAVLEYWSFPEPISTAVGRHHTQVQDDPLATILQIAGVLDDETTATPYDLSIQEMVDEWRRTLQGANRTP